MLPKKFNDISMENTLLSRMHYIQKMNLVAHVQQNIWEWDQTARGGLWRIAKAKIQNTECNVELIIIHMEFV